MDGASSQGQEAASETANEENTSPRGFDDTLDDTTDDSLLRAYGLRTPKVPFRGMSIKEVEERMSTLQKENFSLKLRLYLLEERAGTTITKEKEVIIKENVDLKVQVENQKRELQEKHKLLCEAVKAMEIEEEEYKKTLREKEHEVEELRRRAEKKAPETDGDDASRIDNAAELFDDSYEELQAEIRELEAKLIKEQERSLHLESLVREYERNKTSSTAAADRKKHEQQQRSAEDAEKIERLTRELHERTDLLTRRNQRIEELERELDAKIDEFEAKVREIDVKDATIDAQSNENRELKESLRETRESAAVDRDRVGKYKNSVQQRNRKIMELEETVEKQKMKILNLEGRLETAQNEVKRITDNYNKSPFKGDGQQQQQSSASSDVASLLVSSAAHVAKVSPKVVATKALLAVSPNTITNHRHQDSNKSSTLASPSSTAKAVQSPATVAQANELRQQIVKLKAQETKSFMIIKELLSGRKMRQQEIKGLCAKVRQKDEELRQLRDTVAKYRQHERPTKDDAQQQQQPATKLVKKSKLQNENEATVVENPDELIEHYSELTSELEKEKDLLLQTIAEKDRQMHALQERHDDLLTECKSKEDRIVDLEFELLSACGDGNKELVRLHDQPPAAFWIDELADKDKEIERLEGELRKRTCDLQGIVNNELWEKNREIEKIQSRHATSVDAKDAEIVRLEREITGKDMQLTILKEKISELGVHVNLPPNLLVNDHRAAATRQTVDDRQSVDSLRDELRACKDERKFYLQQIDELRAQLKNTPERERQEQINELRDELVRTRDELTACDRLRNETQDVCEQLNGRLEELAVFLDALLEQKSALGLLGAQTHRLRRIVDQSLDLSRSLSISIACNADESLAQLSNISRLLNSTSDQDANDCLLSRDERRKSILTIDPERVVLTYRSHLSLTETSAVDEQREIVRVLREQVADLKREIVLRDVELEKFNGCGKSESDRPRQARSPDAAKPAEDADGQKRKSMDSQLLKSFLELGETPEILPPHKIVENLIEEQKLIEGQQRVEEESKPIEERKVERPRLNRSTLHWIDSESESWSEPDRNVSIARIGLMEESLRPNAATALTPSSSSRRRSYQSTEYDVDDNDAGESRRKSWKVKENRQTIIALHERVRELEELLRAKEAESGEKIALLEAERAERQQLIGEHDELKRSYTTALERLKAAEDKYVALESQRATLNALIDDLTASKRRLEEALSVKDKESLERINELEAERGRLQETVVEAERATRDARNEITRADERLMEVKREMTALEATIRDESDRKLARVAVEYEGRVAEIERVAEERIHEIAQTAERLRAKYEEEYALKLDEVRADMERRREEATQSANERVLALEEIERALNERLRAAIDEHRSKVDVLRAELDAANLHYSEAVLEKTRLINEKSELETKVHEMQDEQTNLLIRIEQLHIDFRNLEEAYRKEIGAIRGEKSSLEVRVSELESINAELHNRLVRLQAATSPVKQLLSVNRSFSNNSCNDGDKELANSNNSPNNNNNNNELERQQATSSPDLGIDSDHGRFSSLEANVNARPFLRTLEVTASMSNLLDVGSNCSNEQCCAKTKEIINENSDLRRRLMRTRRALEETVTQLTMANQRKKQVEKAICKQIHKTSEVLRIAKANLNSGSDSDLAKP